MRLRKRPPTAWKKITLATGDVCYLYGVTQMTVWNWRQRGMPYREVHVGKFSKGSIQFNLYEIANWLEQRFGRWPDDENHLRDYIKK